MPVPSTTDGPLTPSDRFLQRTNSKGAIVSSPTGPTARRSSTSSSSSISDTGKRDSLEDVAPPEGVLDVAARGGELPPAVLRVEAPPMARRASNPSLVALPEEADEGPAAAPVAVPVEDAPDAPTGEATAPAVTDADGDVAELAKS